MPQPGTRPTTQSCALARNWTRDVSLCGMTPKQLSHADQGSSTISNCPCICIWSLSLHLLVTRYKASFPYSLTMSSFMAGVISYNFGKGQQRKSWWELWPLLKVCHFWEHVRPMYAKSSLTIPGSAGFLVLLLDTSFVKHLFFLKWLWVSFFPLYPKVPNLKISKMSRFIIDYHKE